MGLVSEPVSPSQMPQSDRQEEFSIAYVSAIVAQAGVNVYTSKKDYGIDMAFSKILKRATDNRHRDIPGVLVPAQLKSSTKWKTRGDTIVYDLEVKNYNDLINYSLAFLILLCLPSTIDEWLYHDEDCLRLYKCCYYWQPEVREETLNDETKTIYIPCGQRFTVNALMTLLDKAQSKVQL